VIIPDVNLLLYSVFEQMPQHDRGHAAWQAALNGDEEVGLAGPALFGFLRLATNARVFERPLDVDIALKLVDGWLERPQVHFLTPGVRHLEIAFRLMRKLGVAGNLTTDVQLAALAIEHQADLLSNDSDFARFEGLRWRNPLL
jgi:toxin-antitoxin system PIN domain toxin